MFILISSYISDLVFGDPEWFPHPVRGVGRLIHLLEKVLPHRHCEERPKGATKQSRSNLLRLLRRRFAPPRNDWIKERLKGVILAILVVGIVVTIAYLFVAFCKGINPALGNISLIYLGYTTLSIKDLRVKVKAVLKELQNNSLVRARQELSKIVGRDTQNLSKPEVIKATVESIAENTNDGIVAPLFYLIIGGPILAILYKTVNTLDSMVGYKNEKYIHFGWFSAKLDDIMNFIPARITGVLIALASSRESFKIMLRDGRKHPSPNSGVPEAAMAGALGIKLGGSSFYQGKISEKPWLGEEMRPTESPFIKEALKISLVSSIIMVSIGVLLKWLI